MTEENSITQGTKHLKPPLGVMPEHLWREERAEQLSKTVYDYILCGFYNFDSLFEWIRELQAHLIWLKGQKNEENPVKY